MAQRSKSPKRDAAEPRQASHAFHRVEIESVDDLRRWLAANHKQPVSIWLVTYKKHTGARYVPYGAIVDEAIAYGWIDSLPRKLDADRSMLLLSRRKSGSAWSKVNKDRVARLEAAGRLAAPGLAVVAAAKADGSWDFLNDVEQLTRPPDLLAAFARFPGAETKFDAFSRSSQRGILEWIKQAKRPETRANRVEETARLAAVGVRANHPKG